jgi:hypothetical protein
MDKTMNTEEARANWEKIKLGWWYTVCCEHDLTQIMAEDELKGMVSDLKNPKTKLPEAFGVWPTKQEALEALKSHSH